MIYVTKVLLKENTISQILATNYVEELPWLNEIGLNSIQDSYPYLLEDTHLFN